MHVFHIKGFSGVLVLLLAIVALAVVLLVLPASFMMVLWNALVFEGLKGPEISLYQGLLLWGVMAIVIKLVFKPEIQLQLVRSNAPVKKETLKQKATSVKKACPDATSTASHRLEDVSTPLDAE